MDNIYFSNAKSASKYLDRYGEEIYDSVYKMSDGKLIKKYNKGKSLDRDDGFCEENLLSFKDINVLGVAFTRALVYSGKSKIYATVTQYVSGESIDVRALGSYQIDGLLNAISKLVITIRKLSDLGIRITDAYRGNIVYDGREFTLIDTTEYRYERGNTSSLYRYNMIHVMKEIFYSIFDDEMFYKYCDSLNIDDYLMHPYQTLINIKNYIEKCFGVKINTFDDRHSLFKMKSNCKIMNKKR